LDKEEVRRLILEHLSRGGLTSEQLRDATLDVVDPMTLREVLSDLVRQGVVEKVPQYEKRKFLFRLKTRS
jgi:DNA-binding HxlR family transcriptional regulator